MKLIDLYNQFSIPENLRTHMLRVAGVGGVICDNLSPDINIDKDVLVKALLVHDMGNIVKFDFSIKSIHTDQNEVAKLQQIQREFIAKYGTDDHEVTKNILIEAGIDESIISVTQNMSSSMLETAIIDQKWTEMIATYCDFRVSPFGVVLLNTRIDDLIVRMRNRTYSDWSSAQKAEKYRIDLNKCQEIIQDNCEVDLGNINDEMVEKYFEDFLLEDFDNLT